MQTQPDELLRRLTSAHFEFVLIGGLAATVHGCSVVTDDFDVTAPFTEDNLGRLLKAFTGEHLVFSAPHRPPVPQTAAQLVGYRNLYLLTPYGRLDVLGEVQPIGQYEIVASRAVSVTLLGYECRVMALDDLIAVKAHVARPKDKLVEQELRAIRAALAGRYPR